MCYIEIVSYLECLTPSSPVSRQNPGKGVKTTTAVIPVKACPQLDWGRESNEIKNLGFRIKYGITKKYYSCPFVKFVDKKNKKGDYDV